MDACNCRSYNWGIGEDRSVMLDPMKYFDFCDSPDPIPVDPCIADDVAALWDAKIWTIGSCCGHNTNPPSVVLSSESDAQQASEILADRDPSRPWAVLFWALCEYRCGEFLPHQIKRPSLPGE